MLFGILTNRRFVIDHAFFFTHFDSPSPAFSINYNEIPEVQALQKSRGNTARYPFGPGSDPFKALSKFLNSSLKDMDLPESVITFGCGCTFDAIFFENIHTSRRLHEVFGTSDRANVTEKVLSWLLQRLSLGP